MADTDLVRDRYGGGDNDAGGLGSDPTPGDNTVSSNVIRLLNAESVVSTGSRQLWRVLLLSDAAPVQMPSSGVGVTGMADDVVIAPGSILVDLADQCTWILGNDGVTWHVGPTYGGGDVPAIAPPPEQKLVLTDAGIKMPPGVPVTVGGLCGDRVAFSVDGDSMTADYTVHPGMHLMSLYLHGGPHEGIDMCYWTDDADWSHIREDDGHLEKGDTIAYMDESLLTRRGLGNKGDPSAGAGMRHSSTHYCLFKADADMTIHFRTEGDGSVTAAIMRWEAV